MPYCPVRLKTHDVHRFDACRQKAAEGWERVGPLPGEAGSAFKTPPAGEQQHFFYCVKFTAS
ncbi:uncharacterized protein Dmul_20740 [Desulfococcus multivorans]|nr:uncharacterized protein Dmul_20740 [Desulfococcus multivorans]